MSVSNRDTIVIPESKVKYGMKDEEYEKAVNCCKTLDCDNCPIKEKDYCQELLDAEKFKREQYVLTVIPADKEVHDG